MSFDSFVEVGRGRGGGGRDGRGGRELFLEEGGSRWERVGQFLERDDSRFLEIFIDIL